MNSCKNRRNNRYQKIKHTHTYIYISISHLPRWMANYGHWCSKPSLAIANVHVPKTGLFQKHGCGVCLCIYILLYICVQRYTIEHPPETIFEESSYTYYVFYSGRRISLYIYIYTTLRSRGYLLRCP